jgi:hypothetical protein
VFWAIQGEGLYDGPVASCPAPREQLVLMPHGLIFNLNLLHQLRRKAAKLIRGELIEIGRRRHGHSISEG